MSTMKNISLKWGVVSGVFIVGVPLISYLIMGGGPETFKVGEIIGYSTIILSLLLIFIAIHEYRKLQPDLKVSFGRGFTIGVLISLIAGMFFGIYNVIYVEFLEPDFMDQYYNYYIEQIQQSGKSENVIAEQIKQFEQDKAMFTNTFMQFFLMFFTVFGIGVVVSVFCAAIQSRMHPQSTQQ